MDDCLEQCLITSRGKICKKFGEPKFGQKLGPKLGVERYGWKSSDSALGYFISKITSQEHKFFYKKSSFIIFGG